MRMYPHRPGPGVTAIRVLAIVIVAGALNSICSRESKDSGNMTSDERRIDEQLAPSTSPPQREGLAAVDPLGFLAVPGGAPGSGPVARIARRAPPVRRER